MKLEINTVSNKAEHQAATTKLADLMSRHPRLSPEENALLDILGLLVNAYENKHFPLKKADPIAILEFVMEQRGLTRADLIPVLGSKSKISEILARKRPLSLNMIRALHRGLGISPSLLVEEYALTT